MNLYEQLIVVRERLEGIGAHDDSMDLVETLLKRAEPAKTDKTNITRCRYYGICCACVKSAITTISTTICKSCSASVTNLKLLLVKMQPLLHMSTLNAIQNQNHSIRQRKKEKKRRASSSNPSSYTPASLDEWLSSTSAHSS